MTANATHPGRITIPGTDLAVSGTLVAEPQTEDMLLSLDDRLAVGPVKVDVDSAGNLYSPGLVVPIVSGVLWLLRFEPHRHDIPDFVLGIFNLNTSGVPLDDLVPTVPHIVDETDFTAISDAIAAVASINREASGGIMGIGSDGKIADGKRISTALGGLNVLNYGTVTAGGDLLAAWNAAGLAASKTAGIAPPRVYVPYCSAGYYFSNNPTIYDGVTYEGLGYVTLKASTSRARLLNLDGKTDVTLRGFTFDLAGTITTAAIDMDSASTDCTVDDCRFVNSTTVSYAVTNKELTGNVAILTIGAHGLTGSPKAQVHGVNGTSAADAAAFNTGSGTLAGNDVTLTVVDSTRVSYPVTHANVTSVATSGGWLTVGSTLTGVFSVSCDTSVRPRITNCWFNGVRAPIRMYQGVTGFRITDNRFSGWGDRAIFIPGTASGHASNGKILRNQIEAPSQKFGEPHQPIAVQGVAGFWHTNIECAHNIIDGAVSGGNLVGHHTGKSSNDLLGGTADAISFHHSKLVNIHHNTVTNSGEVGITVSNDSQVVNVEDNIIEGTNSVPIALDWGVGSSFVKTIKVQNNVLRNGGQERGQAVTGDSPRAGTGSAVWLAGTTNCTVGGNTCEDDQGVATMTALSYIKDTTVALTINENTLLGGVVKQNVDASVITADAVKFNHSPVTTVTTSDTAAKNDATLANLPTQLTRTLDRGAAYDFELVLGYTTNGVAGATPGIKIGFASMTGGTTTFWPDSGGSTSTGAASTSGTNSNRSFFTSIASTVLAGGVTGAVPVRMVIRGRVKNGGSTAQTFQPMYAQQTLDAVNGTVVVAGSSLTTWRRA